MNIKTCFSFLLLLFLLSGCFVVVEEGPAYRSGSAHVGRPYYNRPYYGRRPYAPRVYYGDIDRPYVQERRRQYYYNNDD